MASPNEPQGPPVLDEDDLITEQVKAVLTRLGWGALLAWGPGDSECHTAIILAADVESAFECARDLAATVEDTTGELAVIVGDDEPETVH